MAPSGAIFFGTKEMRFLSSLLSKPPIQKFATQLTDDIEKRYPVHVDADPKKRPSVNRLTRIVEDVCVKGQSFQKEHRLGWLGKAKLGNAFRWELKERGYQQDFIDLATEALVVYISKKP